MVRIKMSFDASRAKKKAAALDSELRSRLKKQPPASHSASNKTPSTRDERTRQALRTFEPVEPGFYDYVKNREAAHPEKEIILTSNKIGRYRVSWPNMGDNQGAMERFSDEHKLGAPTSPNAPFDANDWQEPNRMVVPQDAFDAYLAEQERQEESRGIWGKTWRHLLGQTIFALSAPSILRRIFSPAEEAQAKADIREVAKEAIEKVGL